MNGVTGTPSLLFQVYFFFFDGSAEKAHPFHFEMTFILQGCEVLS